MGIWVRLCGLIAILGVAIAAGLTVGVPDVSALRAWTAESGRVMLLPLAMGAFGALSLMPVPKSVLATTTGALLGLVPGLLVVLVGALVGSVVAFGLARVLGRGATQRVTWSRLKRVNVVMSEHGLTTVLAARLSPLIPFTVFNYAAGLSRLRVRDYIVGTALGIVPGSIVCVYVGASAASARWESALPIALSAVAVALVAAAIWSRRSAIARDLHIRIRKPFRT